MVANAIGRLQVRNTEWREEYRAGTGPLVEKYGGNHYVSPISVDRKARSGRSPSITEAGSGQGKVIASGAGGLYRR